MRPDFTPLPPGPELKYRLLTFLALFRSKDVRLAILLLVAVLIAAWRFN